VKPFMTGFGHDIVTAFRRLRRSPGFTVFSAVTFAAALTATITVHAVLHDVVWRTPAVTEPERIASLIQRARPSSPHVISLHDFLDYESRQKSFRALTASMRHATAVPKRDGSEMVVGEALVGDYFEVFGVAPVAGRLLTRSDARPDSPAAVVLGETLSRSRFGNAIAAVGQRIVLGGHVFEVAGVVPADFPGLGNLIAPASYWAPLEHLRHSAPVLPDVLFDPARRNTRPFSVRGRLADGITLKRAAEEAEVLGQQLEAAFPSVPEWVRGPESTRQWSVTAPLDREGQVLRALATVVMVGVVLVLMLACTNLANLGLSRMEARRRELLVRHRLGASRWRLVRAQGVEAAIPVAMGVGLAVPLVHWALVRLHLDFVVGPGLMFRLEPEVTWSVAVLAAVSIALAVVLVGLLPAWRATRAATSSSPVAPRRPRPRWRLQRTLIVMQATGSVALLMVAASTLQTVTPATDATGVDLDSLGVLTVDDSRSRDGARALQARDEVLRHLQQSPGIRAAAASVSLPFGTPPVQGYVAVEPAGLDGNAGTHVYVVPTTEQIWDTLGLPLIQGRTLSADEVRQDRPVIVLSAMTARQVFGTVDVVGRTVFFKGTRAFDRGHERLTVTGVSGDADTFSMGSRESGLAFLPLRQTEGNVFTLTARAATAEHAVAALHAAVRQVKGDYVTIGAGTGWTMLSGRFYFLGALSWLSSLLGGLTLVLVMTGLYSVLSASLAQRRRELGIRMAVGCTPAGLIRLAVGEGAGPALVGLLLGIGVGTLARVVVRAILPSGLSVIDPTAIAAVSGAVVVSVLAAIWRPASRAASIDPVVELRRD